MALCACSPGQEVLQFLESDLAGADHCPASSLTSISAAELTHLESSTLCQYTSFQSLELAHLLGSLLVSPSYS